MEHLDNKKPESPEKRKKVLLFYNPYSGDGMFKSNLDRIIEKFQSKQQILVPLRADNRTDLADILATMDFSEYSKIIAAGGDGTINIVVNAMIKTDCHLPIAVFPAGTANDYAHYFNIPTDLDGMLEIAAGDTYVSADIGRCNERYFVNVAAIGSVIDVSQKTDSSMKNALGIFAYYLKALTELGSLKPVPVTITADDRTFTEKIFFMVVLNGNSAGGFRKLGSNSSINDGVFDVIMFKEAKLADIPFVALSVLQGTHSDNDNVIYFQTSKIRIESEQAISTDVDGEIGAPLPLDIEMVPKRLRVCVSPQEQALLEEPEA